MMITGLNTADLWQHLGNVGNRLSQQAHRNDPLIIWGTGLLLSRCSHELGCVSLCYGALHDLHLIAREVAWCRGLDTMFVVIGSWRN